MPGRRRVWIFLLLIMAIAAVGAHRLLKLRGTAQPNVLWITMDSLRADHLGCDGHQRAHTPNIDALACQGALFTQSIAQSNYTRMSVPSMITGKYPTNIEVKTIKADLGDSFVTLAEALLAQKYATYAIPPEWPKGLYQGFEMVKRKGNSTDLKTQACLNILNGLDQRPFFIWLYYWDPHSPYRPPEEFALLLEPNSATFSSGRIGSRPGDEEQRSASDLHGKSLGTVRALLQINQGKLTLSQENRDHLINLYDAEIAFVDSKIKEVTDKIKELGLWDNTMVVLNADHGEAFGEHDRYYHGHTIYEEEVRVPLIIKPPRSLASGKVIDGPVRNLDIMPTILDYCGVRFPEDLDGRSLRPFVEKDLSPDLPACIEAHNLQTQKQLMGYRTGRYKLIYDLTYGGVELYDLASDPQERDDLLVQGVASEERQGSSAQLEAQLREKLLKSLGMQELAALKLSDVPTRIDRKTKEQLRTLGYIY